MPLAPFPRVWTRLPLYSYLLYIYLTYNDASAKAVPLCNDDRRLDARLQRFWYTMARGQHHLAVALAAVALPQLCLAQGTLSDNSPHCTCRTSRDNETPDYMCKTFAVCVYHPSPPFMPCIGRVCSSLPLTRVGADRMRRTQSRLMGSRSAPQNLS
jgi:hypothetical protein